MHSSAGSCASLFLKQNRGVSSCLRRSGISKGWTSSVVSMESGRAASEEMGQIKRLRYLLDAREAKVQLALDEAMSWLISPFGESGGAQAADKDEVACSKGALASSSDKSASSGGIGDTYFEGPVPWGEPDPPPLVDSPPIRKAEPTNELLHGSDPSTKTADTLQDAPTPLLEGSGGVAATSVPAGVSSCELPALSAAGKESQLETSKDVPEAQNMNRDTGGPLKVLSAGGGSAPGFSAEELEKLDVETAWDELDADEDMHAADYYVPLLPQLLSATSSSRVEGVPVKFGGRKGALVSANGNSTQGTDSPKRKRGRPKGSGKKAKLEKARQENTVPAAAFHIVKARSPASPDGADAFPVLTYDSQSPGSSGLASSPAPAWCGGSPDTYLPLADLVDISADSSIPGSCIPSSARLPSPATPSSGTFMPRSFSTASSAGSALILEDRGLPAQAFRSSVRSARVQAGLQVKRLTFNAVDEDFGDVPQQFKETKKPTQKGKTGRPRGRPRKIRPQNEESWPPVESY